MPLLVINNTIQRPEHVSICNSRRSVTTALLTRLTLPRSRFIFDGSVLGPTSPRFTFFAMPSTFNVIATSGRIVFGYRTNAIMISRNATGKGGLPLNGTCLRGLCSSVTGEWHVATLVSTLRKTVSMSAGVFFSVGQVRGVCFSCFVDTCDNG